METYTAPVKKVEEEVPVWTVEGAKKQDELLAEAQGHLDKITKETTPENLVKMSKEKQESLLSKLSILTKILIALGVAGAAAALSNIGAMDMASTTGQATAAASIGTVGTITAVATLFGSWFNHLREQHKK